MNQHSQPVSKVSRRRGMALVIVIGALALATMLLLAMFSLTESEYKSTQSYVAGLSAKQFADTAVAIVQAQIQNGQNTATNATDRKIHATQPGMVRVYNASGTFAYALKLYSSSKMRINGPAENAVFEDSNVPPTTWDTMPARYVDLNDPVVRPSLGGGGGTAVFYPIIDPRAYYDFVGPQYTPTSPPPVGAKTTQMEGFSYNKQTISVGSAQPATYGTVRMPAEVADPTQLRLPMPVEWIYILQDGTMGTLNAANSFVGLSPATVDNPIVSRIAFWTDDESCKININTASEPTFMAPPYYFHDRDRRWAHFPGASSEYQRYPGHPATVALSTVLAPNMRLDPLRPQDDGFGTSDTESIVTIKERIYDLAPKISTGGSLAGTLPFVSDEFSQLNGEGMSTTQLVNTATARAERLYASVDEMLFVDGQYSQTGGRVAARYDIPGSSVALFDHDTLERSRFFLTAHSRAPEFSIYGLPRVCMWPVADGEGAGNPKRTNFDNMIALCATLSSGQTGSNIANSYFFRRAEAHHSTHDVTGSASGYPASSGLARNSRLMEYLVRQMNLLVWPQNSLTGNSPNFTAKYGEDNVRQLAVQFFDYVRCINLYDGILARGNNGMTASGKSLTPLYQEKDTIGPARLTYTEQRVTPPATNVNASANNTGRLVADDEGSLPGHGQVTPAVWQNGTKIYKGFGRMFTLSEIGFSIICTADGKNDEFAITYTEEAYGGGTAFRTEPTLDQSTNESPVGVTNAVAYPGMYLGENAENRQAVWYSNFPPLTEASYPPNLKYGTITGVPLDGPLAKFHPAKHPGYHPQNWNLTLPKDKPLAQNEKRVQMMMLLEAFCPALGWTKFHPEYTIVLDGNYIAQIKLNGTSLFDTTGDVVVKSGSNLYEASNVHSCGGHAGPSAISGNRGGRPVSVGSGGEVMMPSDPQWDSNNTSGHNGLTNYGLTSNFITVPRDSDMTLEFPNGELRINLYDSHDYQSRQPIQRISIRPRDLSGAAIKLPTPKLVYNNYPFPEGKTNKSKPATLTNTLSGRELNYQTRVDSSGQIRYRRSTQGPHYWVFNYGGALGRLDGRVNPAYDGTGEFWLSLPAPFPPGAADSPIRQMLRGRLDTQAAAQWGPPGTADQISIFPPEAFSKDSEMTGVFESDVTRTFVPAVGDYRMVAARYDVPADMWVRHPLWEAIENNQAERDELTRQNRVIHSFTTHWGHTESGVDFPPGGDQRLLAAEINYGPQNDPTNMSRVPDLPETRDVVNPETSTTVSMPAAGWARAANSFGDFDAGISSARDGAYINKPDEGNFFAGTFTRYSKAKFYRSGYFYESWKNSDDWRSGIYMTPNRMISSPVMFGSLPTGVWNTGGNGAPTALQGTTMATSMPCRPWQTLLFRPYVRSNLPGYGAKTTHPGEAGPKDHFLLDMFFMPVVEPYAISEPLSVAGRINMNYQIMPFTHIRRATGMHAVLKGEMITAIPDGDAWNSKNFKSQQDSPRGWDTFYDEKQSPQKFWHRPINVRETLLQFDERFNQQADPLTNGLFRSASQICEIHLIPDVSAGITQSGGETLPTLSGLTRQSRPTAMSAFWQNHKVTGENVRERPYSNLYSRLTTRSNTFRVHIRSQVLKKARSTDPAVFDPERDSILSEYRGSTLIERYIDPAGSTSSPIPDYAASANPLALPPLDTFYRFRSIENKRFNP